METLNCLICNREFSTRKSLSKHVHFIHHRTAKEYYDSFLKKSSDGICATCGRPTRFLGIQGYVEHCCNSCAQKDPKVLQKVHTPEHEKNVSIGVRKAYDPQVYKATAAKSKITVKAKYGVDNPAQYEEFKQKMKHTLKKKKEVFCEENDCVPRTELIEKYGQGWLRLGIPCIKYCRASFIKREYLPIIDSYYSKSSIPEQIIYRHLCNYYDGEIIRHARPEFLYGKELDFYLPELQLAIEYNGNYFHCVGNNVGVKDEWYHLEKSRDCWLAGVRLIHIFEFESLPKELRLLKQLLYYGFDKYDLTDNNKYWRFDNHDPKIIAYYNEFPIYSA